MWRCSAAATAPPSDKNSVCVTLLHLPTQGCLTFSAHREQLLGGGAAMRKMILISACSALAGCASSADKIAGAYVSPLQYQNYSCGQLGEEAQRISARVSQVSGVQDQKASNDAVATGVAIILFWPAAFMIGGNDQNTAELSRLKGEFETVEKVSVQKNCGLQFRQQAAPPSKPPRA
jgi:hypothetical protein